MGNGDSYTKNQARWSRTITIALLKDGIEVERKSFPVSLEGNREQFNYWKPWIAKGPEYDTKRI